MAKLNVIDLLNSYLAKGKMPPKELLQQVAQSEALQAPPAALDPVQLASGAYAFGPLSELANEGIGAGAGYALPKLLKMAPTPSSGLAMPVSGRATSDLAGGQTGELLPKGIKLPGGAVAAKGTKAFNDMGGTGEMTFDDSWGAAQSAAAGDQSDFNKLMNVLSAGPEAPIGKLTTPLPPQGAGTTKFGEFGDKIGPMSAAKPFIGPSNNDLWGGKFKNTALQSLPEAPKTEPLTPFEAHQLEMQKLPFDNSEVNMTNFLPGAPSSLAQGGIPNQETRPLNPSEGNRTASLEPADIDEMVGGETPKTADLLEQFAKNLSPKDTRLLPENALYHGLNVFGSTQNAKTLSGIAQEGMKGGWFSEEPHQAFGPNFIATRPEDLPPLLIRDKQFNVDPEKEIFPRWKKMNTENLETALRLRGKAPQATLVPETVKGRPAMKSLWPNIHQLVGADEGGGGHPLAKGGHVVDPEKLFLTNKTGETIGRLAPKGKSGNAVNSLLDKARAFRNVLEKGTTTVDTVWKQLWDENGVMTHSPPQAEKVAKLKQFLKSAPEKGTTLHEIWAKFAGPVKEALLQAGEDIPK